MLTVSDLNRMKTAVSIRRLCNHATEHYDKTLKYDRVHWKMNTEGKELTVTESQALSKALADAGLRLLDQNGQ